MLIRPYQTSDAEALATVYRDAVFGIGSQAYNAEQVAVWADFPSNLEEFKRTLSLELTLVAVEDQQIAAFGQLNPLDHVAFIYTATQFARRGCATEIYQQLEAHARQQTVKQLHTEASRISKFFFLKMGFVVLETEYVERQAVQFERFRMAKTLR